MTTLARVAGMSCSVLVLGLPSAAGCPSGNTWRAAAELVHGRLLDRFGPAVHFEYAELFGAGMDAHPELETLVAEGAIPPVVLIDGVPRFTGGKLNVSAIERAVAAALATRTSDPPAMEAPQP